MTQATDKTKARRTRRVEESLNFVQKTLSACNELRLYRVGKRHRKTKFALGICDACVANQSGLRVLFPHTPDTFSPSTFWGLLELVGETWNRDTWVSVKVSRATDKNCASNFKALFAHTETTHTHGGETVNGAKSAGGCAENDR